MANLGEYNTLTVLKQVDFGYYLDAGELGEVLLPARYAPERLEIDSEIEVFIYLDSEDRPIATTERPFAQVGECAFLKVKEIGEFGAFLDWGLVKDLLVPFKEMRVPMVVGKSYVVCVFIDATERIAASSKLSDFLYETDDDHEFKLGEKVELMIAGRSDIGYKAVIEGSHLGMLHAGDVFKPIVAGQRMTGYIKWIRPDGRINLTLQNKGQEGWGDVAEQVLSALQAQGGTLALTDKSPPEAIYAAFHVSKAVYKKALGKLYKEKKILIEGDTIRLL
jgi:predicted RNA-binding protein (virulence factor B family)